MLKFVKKKDASMEELAREVNGQTGLPMALDHHFRFLLMLPLENNTQKYILL